MGKITAYSHRRWRCDATICHARGVKVGSTMTQFCVSDGTRTGYYNEVGGTPGERRTAAINRFKANDPGDRKEP